MNVSSGTFSSLSFFDLDHTLLTTNSSFSFGKYLYGQGVFSFLIMLQLVCLYSLHIAGLLSISSLHQIIFNRLFSGRSSSLFLVHAQNFVDKKLQSMLYLPAIQELKRAQNEGDFVAILSSSPDFLVEIIAKQLGVTHWRGSQYALDECRQFSHISSLILGEDKARIVAYIAKECSVQTENISVYSDNILDLPFLQCAGKKIAVNPDRHLYAISKKNNWKII